MLRARLLALALTFGLVGCASQPSPDAVRQEVQEFVRNYVDATNKGDVTSMMEMVSERFNAALMPSNAPQVGKRLRLGSDSGLYSHDVRMREVEVNRW